MNIEELFAANRQALNEFAAMSACAGARADYAQGGGGNASVKLADGLMALKASGYRLSQITATGGYAVMDYRVIREFFSRAPGAFSDVEQAGASAQKRAQIDVDGLPKLRPSVEAGFHAQLSRFTLHTHSVYANLVACAKDAERIAGEVMRDLGPGGVAYAVVPYCDPGVKLTYLIKTATENARGAFPNVIFMKNHGIIVTDDDASACAQIHDAVNAAAQKRFGVSPSDFPRDFAVARRVFARLPKYGAEDFGVDRDNRKDRGDREDRVDRADSPAHGVGCYVGKTRWLRDALADDALRRSLSRVVLYPDQMVYLPKIILAEDAAAASAAAADAPSRNGSVLADDACVLYGGSALYHTNSESEALTREETLAGAAFVMRTLMKNNVAFDGIGVAGIDFLSNWDAEKYRKSVAARRL